jgi:glyoxylase I family protein
VDPDLDLIKVYRAAGPARRARGRWPGRARNPAAGNRVVLRVENLPAFIDVLTKHHLRFRNDMETGPGGRQIQIEDPDGNPIELFEPAR